jgi:hypothetical protein
MAWPSCEWCGSAADLVDNYDTLRCWECWDDGGRDKPHNLVFQVLRSREVSGGAAAAEVDDER